MLPHCVVAGLAALSLSTALSAQESNVARYTVSVSGLTAGKVTLTAQHEGARYVVSSNSASAGLAGFFRSFTLISQTQGTERNGRLIPQRYSADAKGARQGRGAELAFDGGLATVIKADPPEPDVPVVDPARHKGVVDPLTGLYSVLRDTTPATACQVDLKMFDGHRVNSVTLSSPQADGDGLTCRGLYRRIDGYPAKELARRPETSFIVTYRPVEGGVLRVTEVSVDSAFGLARMIRDN
ncbi:DUF3108 domain-containing protein [Pseudotabrizicola alkalilacus]|uniref:DUF3108 domain-containing protein n=1 Tax=Pseudotabrizicola alkalilacus TaxID=2305252 RepID=A0A411YWR4_9RHOB|nr:DUF3108 domain-containing protein [Pseudotabrizicola alkalilacus]RGP35334.1 DUF3108 domain-containing protein [Pseudotabrizicola alkalilacus]